MVFMRTGRRRWRRGWSDEAADDLAAAIDGAAAAQGGVPAQFATPDAAVRVVEIRRAAFVGGDVGEKNGILDDAAAADRDGASLRFRRVAFETAIPDPDGGIGGPGTKRPRRLAAGSAAGLVGEKPANGDAGAAGGEHAAAGTGGSPVPGERAAGERQPVAGEQSAADVRAVAGKDAVLDRAGRSQPQAAALAVGAAIVVLEAAIADDGAGGRGIDAGAEDRGGGDVAVGEGEPSIVAGAVASRQRFETAWMRVASAPLTETSDTARARTSCEPTT
jgi:hypothetical protein